MDKKVKEYKRDFLSLEFLRMFCCDFGMPRNIHVFENWMNMSWDEFEQELAKQEINPDQEKIELWKDNFTVHIQEYKALY